MLIRLLKPKLRNAAAALALMQVVPGAALAQDLGGALNLGQLGASMGVSNAISRMGQRQAWRSVQAPPPRNFRAVPGQAVGAGPSYTYAVTPALKQTAAREFIARVRSKNADHGQAIAQQLARHDYDRIYRDIVGPFGLRANDLADSMTAYFVLGWMVATGAGNPSAASVRAARNQIANQLATDPRFAAPGMRANLGEEFKILFVTVHAGWQSARREGNLRDYGNGVARMFQQQSGLNLRSLTLRNGFEPRA